MTNRDSNSTNMQDMTNQLDILTISLPMDKITLDMTKQLPLLMSKFLEHLIFDF